MCIRDSLIGFGSEADQLGAEKAMGDCPEGIEASGSRKAHYVSISPEKDRSGAAEKVGTVRAGQKKAA